MDTQKLLASEENVSDIHLDIQPEFHAMSAGQKTANAFVGTLPFETWRDILMDPESVGNTFGCLYVNDMRVHFCVSGDDLSVHGGKMLDAQIDIPATAPFPYAEEESGYAMGVPYKNPEAFGCVPLSRNMTWEDFRSHLQDEMVSVLTVVPAFSLDAINRSSGLWQHLDETFQQASEKGGPLPSVSYRQWLAREGKVNLPGQLANLIEDVRTYDEPERTRCLKALAVHMTPSEFQDPNRFTNLQEAEQMVSSYLSVRNIQEPSKKDVLDALSFALHEPIHYEDSRMSREAATLYLKLDHDAIPASKILQEWQAKAELKAGIQHFLDTAEKIGLSKTTANGTVMDLLRQAGEKHQAAER